MNQLLKYEMTIKGMRCSNCSNKVESVLKDLPGVKSSNVNLITEKALITIDEITIIEGIKSKLSEMGFEVIKTTDLNTNINNRKLNIKTKTDINTDIIGITRSENNGNILQIEYDPCIIKGYELFEKLGNDVEYINEFIDNINNINESKFTTPLKDLVKCVGITAVLIIFTMFLPESIMKSVSESYIFTPKLSLYLIIVLVLSALIIYNYGWHIYKKVIKAYMSSRLLNMETLIAIGSMSALLLTGLNIIKLISIDSDNIMHSIMMIAHSAEAAATVISIMIIGKYIEDRARENIRKHTMRAFPDDKLKSNSIIKKIKPRNKKFDSIEDKYIDVGLIEKDDICEITESMFLLLDCVIVHGEIEINENITFGDLSSRIRAKGEKLKSGSEIKRILSNKCVVMVEEVLEESMIFKVTKEMSMSINQKLKFQFFLDSIIQVFVPLIILLAIATMIIWLFIKWFYNDMYSYAYVFERAISILVVSCPCAFGLAIPTVTTIALNKALKHGILIKNLSVLPDIKNTKNFVFDKTGTLTEVMRDVKVEYVNENISNYPIYEVLVKMEKSQKHPIAQLIYSYGIKNMTTNNNVVVNEIETASNGIKANIQVGEYIDVIMIGNNDHIASIMKTQSQETIYESLIHKYQNVVFVCKNEEIVLILSLDTTSNIRMEAYGVIHRLKGRKYILSGDHEDSVKELGSKLNINLDDCIGSVDSEAKKAKLRQIRQTGKVLMVGDGLNDILSLSEADFGISFNTNSHLNIVASDIVFLKQNLNLIFSLIKLSWYTNIFIWFNILWAFSYNLCMLPIAGGVFHNIDMSPTFSSFSMLCSSLLIILTSNLLRFINITAPDPLERKDSQIEIQKPNNKGYIELV